ncbi:MAG: type transport system permease protein [Pseudonocardiales bacterium]|jgi:ABC-2 type transport system permease protein|uniref:ABC transporter permease n=1 Tax=Pseudonocardia sp. TaxID=60912 RepID=UPI002622BE9D|nr:ABC transporter permease [Pseudonocardia sp.]MCW2716234.1 Transport permease protein [Pseudonocardia sp.]MDT7612890.1 type transport system permease protein [Pseudonocardiales bacterium]MDT7705893.1 type transport system permease protein [Pseudonocardiales bacterium]
MTTLTETWLIFQRSMRQSLRNPAWVIIGIVQPVLYLALFGPLLVPVIQNTPGFPPGDAYQVLVPALLVQLGLFGSLFVGFGLISEYRAGVIERMRVTPVSRVALLVGRALKDVVVLVVQGILLTLLALPFGLRAPFGGVVIALLLVALLALAMSSASYALALRLKSEDALAPVLNTIVLPLLLLSGILLPMTLAPTWLYDLSRVNPFVYVVDAERAIFRGDLGSVAVVGIVIMIALVVVTVAWGVRTFQRESA